MDENEEFVRMTPFRHALLVFSGLMLLLFFAFSGKESGDMNSALFGTVLYLPYIFLLTGYNAIALMILRHPNGTLNLFKVLIPIVPLILWALLSRGAITIRFWELGVPEITCVIGALGLLNCIVLLKRTPQP